MVIKLKADDPLNQRTYKAVKNFNEKRLRVEKSGKGYTPEKASVRMLKQYAKNRRELTKQVELLEKFNRMGKSSYTVVENKAGGRTNRWKYGWLKANLPEARKYWQKRFDYQKELYETDFHYPVRQERMLNTKRVLELLNKNISEMQTYQLKSVEKYILKMQQEENLRKEDYKNFMAGVADGMKRIGYSDYMIDQFFQKFTQLTPEQFWKMYQESDLITDIYVNIIQSDPKTDEVYDEGLLEAKIMALFKYIDESIAKYKS